MSISTWSNYLSHIPHYLRDEEEPYSLPLILRLEKGDNAPTHEEALLAVVQGIAEMFDMDRSASDPIWDSIELWMQGRIRKVARRARGSAWDKVKASESLYIKYGNAELCILPPHKLADTPVVIKSLQVAGLDLPREADNKAQAPKLLISINPDIQMTTGKSMAQVGHATQLAIFNSEADTLQAWKTDGYSAGFTTWDAYSKWTAEIQDAGFTEVEPGTITIRSILQ
jgi:hypothetical protein